MALFCFIYVCILSANPHLIRDSDENIDHMRVWWYTLVLFMFVVLAFLVVSILQK